MMNTEDAKEEIKLTKRPWFTYGNGTPCSIYVGKDVVCDYVKRLVILECNKSQTPAFRLPEGATRSTMHIWTPEGEEIGAMQDFYPYCHEGRVFKITVDSDANNAKPVPPRNEEVTTPSSLDTTLGPSAVGEWPHYTRNYSPPVHIQRSVLFEAILEEDVD
jgi:hypothetical protein